jgi:hypothetical protein
MSILDGTDEIVDKWLRINPTWAWRGRPLRFWHKKSLQKFLSDPPRNLNGTELVQQLLDRITRNWREAQPRARRAFSQKNWRFDKQLTIDPNNPGLEKRLEKRIAFLTDDDWANQIPTSSGLIESGGKQCNIDLGHRKGTAYSLIELKSGAGADTPLYAAIEILRYGVVYLFSRLHRGRLGYDDKRVFDATTIRLRVLAPRPYYCLYKCSKLNALKWLAEPISQGLALFASNRFDGDLAMDFAFDAFPEGFDCEAADNDLLLGLNGRTRM